MWGKGAGHAVDAAAHTRCTPTFHPHPAARHCAPQAMPGYRNILNLTLNTPGEYTFACLEFCGVSHHVMIRKFTVTP